MTESWKDYRINYYMKAFRRLGMFDEENSEGETDSELHQDVFSELCDEAIAALKAGFKHNGRAANAELNSFGEKSENFSTSSPFWNSDEIESLASFGKYQRYPAPSITWKSYMELVRVLFRTFLGNS